jgi:phage terminase large subunit-like protein
MGKRVNARGVVISTQAARDDHPLSQLIDSGLSGEDPSIYVQLLCAPEDADLLDEDAWRECNPALGKFLSIAEMREAADRAYRIPASEPSFRNLRLNQRVDANDTERVVTTKIWQMGNVPVDAESLAGKECDGGIDLSAKHDLTALVLSFPGKDGFLDVLPFFWTPEGQLESRAPAERDLFKLWIKQGLLLTTPGSVIRLGFIAKKIAELSSKYKIRTISYDRWHIDQLKQELDDIGCAVELTPCGQGFKDMSPRIDAFVEKALSGQIRHGGHPVLASCVTNAIVVQDHAANSRFDKPKSNAGSPVRIDGAVALAMSIGAPRPEVREFQLLWL